MDLFAIFRRHLPHLADKAHHAAPDIYDLEDLLEAAEAVGLKRAEVGWLAWREFFVVVEDALAAPWINFLGRHGYRTAAARPMQGGKGVTINLRAEDGRQLHLVMEVPTCAA